MEFREAGDDNTNLGVVCADVYAETMKLDETMGCGYAQRGQDLGFPLVGSELVLPTTLLTPNIQSFPTPTTKFFHSSDTRIEFNSILTLTTQN